MTLSFVTSLAKALSVLYLVQSNAGLRPKESLKQNHVVDVSPLTIENKGIEFDDLYFPYHSQLDKGNYKKIIEQIDEHLCLGEFAEHLRNYKIRDIRIVFGVSARKSAFGAGCFSYFSYHPKQNTIKFDCQSSAGASLPIGQGSRLRFGVDPRGNTYQTLKVPVGPFNWNHALHNHGATANVGFYLPSLPIGDLPIRLSCGVKVRFISSLADKL